ncbi:hypothetical protein [Alistipes sp.]|uniref:hypothetical protein n=1 Tax=Alistipes sp. TaxID=1872444 RepID=UPI003AF09DF5
MRNVIHVKDLGFSVKSGLITVGHHLGLGKWVIELRWPCPLVHSWLFTLYKGKDRPSKSIILFCATLAPLMMVFHWLFVLPTFGVAFVVAVAGLTLTLCLGWLFSGLGEWLQKIGKLGNL